MSAENIRKLGDDINLLLTKYDIDVEQFALELLLRPEAQSSDKKQFGTNKDDAIITTDSYRIVIVPNQGP